MPDPSPVPPWLTPLVTGADRIRRHYHAGVPGPVVAALRAAGLAAEATGTARDAAVLVLFSGPPDAPAGELPDDATLLLTVRASTLRHHAGQAAFPGGGAEDGDGDSAGTALREAAEETGLEPARVRVLATFPSMFIPPSRFSVVPVLAYAADPGPIGVVDPGETAVVARVPVRDLVDPAHRLMVHRPDRTIAFAGPAFLLADMLVWGFTGQVVSAMLDVAGWARPWDTEDVRDLDTAMALVGAAAGTGEAAR